MKNLRIILVLYVLLMPLCAQAADTPAENVVRGFYAQLVEAMKQGEQLGYSGRYKKLAPVIRAAFNLPLMTQISVGSSWTAATPQEQSDLINAFSDFSVANYASRFTSYDGEQFAIIDETPTPHGVIVKTTLKPKDSDAVALSYLMQKDDKSHFRIVDVFINGTISEIATRRAEFSSIARRDGISALVTSLGQKSKQMEPSS